MQDSTFYVLRSDGDIFAATITDSSDIRTTKYDAPGKANEFESIYYDDQSKLIILVCKDCSGDKKDKLSTWAFDPATRQYVQSPLNIASASIAGIIGKKDIRFKPSAALINPFTNQLMMLSSVNKLLVTADRNGKVIQAYPLSAKYYKQAEGLAIGSDRTLYISNEWAGNGSPNLLVLKYHPSRK
jgi:hypothetical protein